MTLQVNEPSAKYLVRPQSNNEGAGIPPCGWQIKPLGELSEFITSGSRGWASYYKEHGATFIRSQNVLGGQLDFNDHQCVVPPVGSEGSRTRVEFGDLLITITGNSVGNVAYVDRHLGEAYISQHVGLVRLKDAASAAYICRFLSPGAPGNAQIVSNQSGQSKPGLNLKNLRDFVVSIPPKEEQLAIAAALSDVDGLIAGLEKLIVKKRDLKQAAMQQLLTGQTRLPGFSGEWMRKKLGEIGAISGAGVDKKIRLGEQPIRLLNYMDVYKKTFLESSDFSHEVSAKSDQIRRCSVKAGDVFFTPTSEVREDIGHAAVALEDMPDVAYSYHVVRLRLFDGWDSKFSAYPFQTKSFLDQASTACEGSGTRYVITLPKFRALQISYPADKLEQAAIASVLFDIDREISNLEIRLSKTRDFKQGMMQELLTGRTRLA
jgi:type I restriction enzyme S subunit